MLRDPISHNYHCDLIEGENGAEYSVAYGVNEPSPTRFSIFMWQTAKCHRMLCTSSSKGFFKWKPS